MGDNMDQQHHHDHHQQHHQQQQHHQHHHQQQHHQQQQQQQQQQHHQPRKPTSTADSIGTAFSSASLSPFLPGLLGSLSLTPMRASNWPRASIQVRSLAAHVSAARPLEMFVVAFIVLPLVMHTTWHSGDKPSVL